MLMLKNPFSELKKHEWILWSISMTVVLVSNFISKDIQPVTLLATLIGVTALIFVAKGNVWGQIFTVVFSILYSITSFEFRYYGEIITYLGMSAPIAAMSVVSWLRNPYKKGKNEVKIRHLKARDIILCAVLTLTVTVVFYFILRALDTPNLLVSTVSITTSFLASYLMFMRNSYYALAYAANDVVLITLWIFATIESLSYLPMVACFAIFLVNDIYGFASWKLREKKQEAGE
jgi:nicotinamide mononucleotide transporter PnuC